MTLSELETKHWGGGFGPAPAICGSSAINGLGFTPHQTWAFRRAELTAYAETPFRCTNALKAIMAHVRMLDPRASGVTRMLPLLRSTLSDHLDRLRQLPPTAAASVVVCLPDRMEGGGMPKAFMAERKAIEKDIRDLASRIVGRPVDIRTVARAHASLAYAMMTTCADLASGKIAAAVVGGVDTHYDPVVVQELIDTERIFDSVNLDSFIGGEGAAFLLLASPDTVARLDWAPIGWVHSAATNRELATMTNDVVNLGLGLSRPARSISDRLKQEHRSLDWWIGDMTAEEFRINEFQLSWTRAVYDVMGASGTLDFLYENLGDLGAAAMPTGAAIALEGFRRGDPAATSCMITGSSPSGDRGVVLLAAAE